MNVLILQVFVSLMLVVGSLVLFAFSVRHRDHEHADRLSLFPLEHDTGSPLEDDGARVAAAQAAGATTNSSSSPVPGVKAETTSDKATGQVAGANER